MEDSPRARLLKYIAEHQPVSVKQIKTDLGMSIGSIYHHLSGLSKLVAQDQQKRYMISAEGNAFLERGAIDITYERPGKGASNGSHDARSSGSSASSHPRTLLLRFIASNGSVSIKQIKDNLGLNTGSIYHHLSKLENLVEQDAMNRYRLSAEGMRVLGVNVPSSMNYSSDYTIQVPKEIVDLGEEKEYLARRVTILKFLSENPKSSIAQIKNSIGAQYQTVQTHLKKLAKYVSIDNYGRFELSALGKSLVARYQGNYQEIYKFLLEEAKNIFVEKIRAKKKGALGVKTNRTIYDLIAAILDMEMFTISLATRKVGISVKRAQELLSLMREKGLIEDVKEKELPEGYSHHPSSKYHRVTKKGGIFLRRYKELANMIR